MEWTRDFIHLTLDGVLLTAVDLSETHDARYGGGNPEHTKFPSRFEVEYVRVYQKRT